jgi:hypothetical protein
MLRLKHVCVIKQFDKEQFEQSQDGANLQSLEMILYICRNENLQTKFILTDQAQDYWILQL